MGIFLQGVLAGYLGFVGLSSGTSVLLVGSQGEQAIAVDVAQSVANAGIQNRGNQIRLNGKTIRGTWAQWAENGVQRFGIESMSLEKSLGMELLNSDDLSQQSVVWFGDRPYSFPIKFVTPYRYLDISELVRSQGWQPQITGNVLDLQVPTAVISQIRQGYQTWGQRIVVNVDRPILWRQATPTQIILQGSMDKAAIASSKPLPFSIASSGQETQLNFPANSASRMQLSSLNNPPRLVIDLRLDPIPKRSIQWLPGVRWRQESIARVKVTWLEIDPVQGNLKLAPISPAASTIIGAEPMINQGETNQAIAAINAGFFNRDNRYPLGAIRRDGIWRSSPILNRGAVAWDNAGNWVFDRLSVQEQFTASNGEKLAIDLVNSGYVKAGVSRYTLAWGSTYTPLVDNEVVLTVLPDGINGDKIVKQESAGKVSANTYVIPPDGYLLVFRSFQSGATKFPVGTGLKRTEIVTPPSFASFPNVVGGGPLLVKNGQVVLNGKGESFSTAFNLQSASRSAIARTRDNKIILATLHGSAEETAGATLRQWANILIQLGATDALNLDGGGSTSLAIGGNLGDRHATTAGRVNNGIGLFTK